MQRIAVLVETSANFGREIIRGVADWARQHVDWQLVVEPGDATVSDLLPVWSGDGIICRARGPALAAAVAACDLPRVMLNPPPAAPAGQRHAQLRMPLGSPRHIARAAFDYLRGLGLREFAFCDHPERGGYTRGELFQELVGEAGFPCAYWRTRHPEPPLQPLIAWLEALPRPCGLWCTNDDVGLRILELARSLGISVPGDLVVLGCDDDAFLCELATPQLASISIGAHALGCEAARLLAELLAGRQPKPRAVAQPRVVPRASSEWSGCADPLAARALARLTGADRPRSSGELADRLGVSVRSLERHVRAATGRTPGQLTRAQRLATAQRLLADSSLTINEVAARSGYSSATRLGEALKRATGLSPLAWRRANAGA